MKRGSLYDLQSRWDDERAAQRIAELRASIRPQVQQDRRWMASIMAAAALLALLFAVVTP
jgi:hypothetical protein